MRLSVHDNVTRVIRSIVVIELLGDLGCKSGSSLLLIKLELLMMMVVIICGVISL